MYELIHRLTLKATHTGRAPVADNRLWNRRALLQISQFFAGNRSVPPDLAGARRLARCAESLFTGVKEKACEN